MNIIIFSKDRAMQLDLLLRSINDHFPFGKVTVLWAASTQNYQKGYDIIAKKYDVSMVWQLPFKRTLVETIKNDNRKYVLMMVDDSVVIEKITGQELEAMFGKIDHKLIKCGSLTLGKNINYSYPHNRPMKIPYGAMMFNKWDWTLEGKRGDWGMPHQVGGNIWDKDYLLKLLRWKKFSQPTEMESKINWPYRKRKISTPLMVCFDHTKVLTIPVNYIPKTTGENKNSGKYSLAELNKKYLDGYQISTKNIYNTETNAICKEIDFNFEKR